MANKSATKTAKDNAFKAKHVADAKAKAVIKRNVEAAKSTAVLTVVENIEHVAQASKSVDASRYKTTGAEYGFTIAEGMEKNKPEAAKYRVDPQHQAYAASFFNGDSSTITTQLNKLSETTANLQGMIACACAGLAARIVKEGKEALPYVNALIEALEPLGKGLGFGRINAIRIWFTEMACLDYEKSRTQGEGKVFTINDKKRQKEAAKFGRNNDSWIAERISRPFWLVKPEKELGDFDLMKEIEKLYERAEKAEKKPEGYKVVDLTGFEALKMLKATVKKAPKVEVATSNDPAIAESEAA